MRANGLDVGYEVTGDGAPLVLLHGASSGRDDFAAQLPLLRSGFRCFLPDARGHGATRWDAAEGFHYAWLIEDALAFADALRLDTFHALGFSMGAATALGLAARAPERLRSLVLVSVSVEREPRARSRGGSSTRNASPATSPRGPTTSRAATTRSRARAPGGACSRRSPRTSRTRSSWTPPGSPESAARRS